MRILFCTSSLFPYRVNWLDQLGKSADIDVYYLMDTDSARNTQWCAQRPKNCTYTLMKSIKLPKVGLISFDFIKKLKKDSKEYDAVILDGYGFPTQLLNISYLNRKRLEYYVSIDGMVPKDKENRLVYKIKKSIISRIPHCLCGAYATNKELMNYGAKPENIVNHPFTSLYRKDIFSHAADSAEKAELRKKLNIPEERVVISVGRFSYLNGYGKGYDVLLKAAKNMPDNIGWYVIGGQPTEEFAQMKRTLGTQNVHFVEFLRKEELVEFYRASDVFVLMTVGDVWGLVVNEAMACGLPVITTDKCVAGLDLVTDDENGYIVPVGDVGALSEKLGSILSNPQIIEKMSQSALERIAPYTIENMVQIHLEAIHKNLEGRS